MARTKTGIAETREEIRKWEEKFQIFIPQRSKSLAALVSLREKGCDPVQLLELLRIYRSPKSLPYKEAKRHAEARRKKVTELVDRLNRDAILASELFDSDPPLSEELAKMADNVVGLNRIHQEASYKFTRKFGGTVLFLVLASRLIMATTKRPHYKEQALILEAFPAVKSASKNRSPLKAKDVQSQISLYPDPRLRATMENIAILSVEKSKSSTKGEEALGRQIRRFPDRNPSAIVEDIELEELKAEVHFWLEAWHSLEAEFEAKQKSSKVGVPLQSSTPAFKSRVQSSKLRVESSKFGVQVQGTLRASSSNIPTLPKKKPGHET
jgi:hypothetical protein